MRSGFPVHKLVLLDTLQVFVLLQVVTHLHVFWVGLEVGVGSRRCLVRSLQLRRDGGELSWLKKNQTYIYIYIYTPVSGQYEGLPLACWI